jgi:hypothetical protein
LAAGSVARAGLLRSQPQIRQAAGHEHQPTDAMHRMFETQHTEYHLRLDECVGVRDKQLR